MKIIFFFFFLLFSFLHSSDTNSSNLAIDFNLTLNNYEKLLKNLEDENESVEYIKLQKSMLYKLINITKFYKVKDFNTTKLTKVVTQDDFIALIEKIVFYRYEVNLKEQELQSIKDKLELIKINLYKIPKENPNLLTYQLQYNFYKLTLDRIESSIKELKEEILKEIIIFNNAYEKLNFQYNKAQEEILKLEIDYNTTIIAIQENNIEQDRLFILSGSRNDKINDTLEKLQFKKDDILKKLIVQNLILQFYYLKLKDDNAFIYQKKIDELIEKLSANKKLAKDTINEIINPIVSEQLGVTKVIAQKTKQSIWDIAKLIWDLLNKELFSMNDKPMSIISIFLAIFIIVIGINIARIFKSNVRENSIFTYISPSSKTIIGNVGYYLILLISFFILLKTIGLDLSSFAIIAGALSVGIGFGLQNIISNLVSGIILMFEKSIKLGDFIEINSQFMGRVTDIKMRSTTVLTNDHLEVIIPNLTFIQNNVINWTHSNNMRRFRIPFGVAYGTDISKVSEAILKSLHNSNIEYIKNIQMRKPQVMMTGMNSSSVDFELLVWIEGEMIMRPKIIISDFLVLIYNALYENNIEIPFPQLDLHIKSIKDKIEILNSNSIQKNEVLGS